MLGQEENWNYIYNTTRVGVGLKPIPARVYPHGLAF
jgi:hypothetical protein